MRTIATLVVLLAATAFVGCEGSVSIQGGSTETGFSVPIPSAEDDERMDPEDAPIGTIVRPETPEDDVCELINPGDTPLRRLTIEEYNNAVRDVFSFAQVPTQRFSPDEKIGGFNANVFAGVTELGAEEYQQAAEAVSEAVVANIGSVLPADADDAAVRAFVTTYGRRAWRRPLETDEVDRFATLYQAGVAQADAETAARMVIEAMVQSPFFLYRLEQGVGAEEDVVNLTDWERASRLSFFLWGSVPDDSLLDAAERGELGDATAMETQARRMMQDPRARIRINSLLSQWLQLERLEQMDKSDPAFDENVRQSMIAETQTFIDHVVWEGDGKVSTLLTADYSFMDSTLAELYGTSANAEDGMVRTALPEGRLGILGTAGVMAAHGHGQMPVYRGKFVREAFLCTPPPEPPDQVEPLPTFDGESMRSKSEKRLAAKSEGCAACHGMMDGIGLTFDMYDSLGRYQTEDEFGNALTDNGSIMFNDGEVSLQGVDDLARALSTSEQVEQCVSIQFFRATFGRMNSNDDACSMHMVQEALAQSGNDVKELFVALTTTDAFLYRRNPALQM